MYNDEEPAVQFFGQHIPYLRVSVFHISSGKAESYDFPMIITGKMQIEAMTASITWVRDKLIS